MHFEITIIEKNMPTGNAEPSIIADAKSIIEACIICLYIVYDQKKRFWIPPPKGGIQKIAERQNIYILEVSCFLEINHSGLSPKN